MNTHDATKQNDLMAEALPTAGTPSLPKVRPPDDSGTRKREVNLDWMFASFHDEFGSDAARAADRLWCLLLDPLTCEARCCLLIEAANSPEGQQLLPAGFLLEPHEFLRELWWLATGRLREAVDSGKADVEYLAQLASNPAVLRLAHRAVMEGEAVLDNMIKEHQVRAWNWLRGEIDSGHLQRRPGSTVVGKHVAIWRREQPYEEFEVGDAPHTVRMAAAERWFVSEEFIAETFVDPF